jgi:DNA-binding NarL/FixJ family response regulator
MLSLPDVLRTACRALKSGEAAQARLSSIRSNQLSMAVRRVDYGADGARYIVIFEKDIPPIIPEERLKRHGLTSREIDIAHLVSAGMTNPQIAEKLCISPRTVQNHLRSIFDKTGIHNRTSLVYRLTAQV